MIVEHQPGLVGENLFPFSVRHVRETRVNHTDVVPGLVEGCTEGVHFAGVWSGSASTARSRDPAGGGGGAFSAFDVVETATRWIFSQKILILSIRFSELERLRLSTKVPSDVRVLNGGPECRMNGAEVYGLFFACFRNC